MGEQIPCSGSRAQCQEADVANIPAVAFGVLCSAAASTAHGMVRESDGVPSFRIVTNSTANDTAPCQPPGLTV